MRAENRFDQWIWEAMQDASVPLNPDHWSKFQTELDAADATEASDTPQPEDSFLRDKLEHIDVPVAVSHWAAFSQILDQELPIEGDFDILDSLVRTRMSNLETPAAAAASWSAMSAKLDETMPTSEARFDDTVRHRMQKMEAPYNANHWAQMRERLERQRRWRYLLVRYKVAEVALMVLLLFTAVNWFIITPTLRERHTTHSTGSGIPATPAVPYAPLTTPEAGVKEAMPSVLKPRKKSEIMPAKAAASLPFASLDPSVNNTAAAMAVAIVESSTTVSQLTLASVPTMTGITASSDNLSFTLNKATEDKQPVHSASNTEAADIALVTEADKVSLGKEDKVTAAKIVTTPASKKRSDEVVNLDNISVTEVAVAGLSSKAWHWGTLLSADLDNVTTPYDADRRRKPYEVVGGGAQIGLTADYTKDKATIAAGIVIGQKHYDTPMQFEFGNFHDGYFVEKLESIRFRIFSIPVSMRYRLSQKGRHRFYAIGGVNFNGILNSKYNRVTRRLSNDREEQELPLPNPLPPSPSADIDWPVGMLQGGTNEDNIFSTGTIGLGYEYIMGPKTSLYIQPTYRHYLSAKGLGPKHDTFNSISLQVGTRTAL